MAQAGGDIVAHAADRAGKVCAPHGASAKMFEDRALSRQPVKSLKQDVIGDIGSVLWVLMGTIGIVLLIACANVANLLLVRAEGRQQELAIRAALGAGWGRIAGELLLESVTLGCGRRARAWASHMARYRLWSRWRRSDLPRLDEIAHRSDGGAIRNGGVSLVGGCCSD